MPHMTGNYARAAGESNNGRRGALGANELSGAGSVLLTRYGSIAAEHVLDHTVGELVFAKKNLTGMFLFEQNGVFFTVRADDRFDPRVYRARDLNHSAHVQGVGSRNHEHAGSMDMRLDQYVGIRSVAGDGGDAA